MATIKRIKVSDVNVDKTNANAGTERGRKFIEDSLEKYGLGRSILLDKHGNIIAGNKTFEAFKAAGGKEIMVVGSSGDLLVAVQREDLTLRSTKAKKLAIADNRASELDLSWDIEVLGSLDFKLDDFFNDSELRKLLGSQPGDEGPIAQIDRAAELQQKWQTERGQIWEIGKHRLMCGDCTIESETHLMLQDDKPGICITDPPYGVEYDPNWRNECAQKGLISYAARRVGEVQNDDRIDWRAAFIIFTGDVIYCWHAGRHASKVQESLEAAGFDIRSQIIWAKNRFAISRGHYHWQHEPCWYAIRQGKTASWLGDRSQTTLWQFDLDPNVEGGHSTQKPLECMARGMRNHQGNVYDPFLGTATTMVAAEKEKRRCFGMEIEPKYVAVALERMSDMGLKPKRAR